MIHAVTVTNAHGESLRLDLRNPYQTGLAIESITGLGPVNADVAMTDYATLDGGLFSNSRLTTRNIVIQLRFIWYSETIEMIRHKTYKYFPVKQPIILDFETDERNVLASGYVESNEPNIFSANEGCQISILCPDSYFYSGEGSGTTIVEFSKSENVFEIPFDNNSLT